MNIFFTNTPYHVLLSYSIAQEYDSNVLIAVGEEPGNDLIEAIDSHPSSPFEWTVVANEKGRDSRLLQMVERLQTIRSLRSTVTDIDEYVHRVHVFHKGGTEPLALLHLLEKDGLGYDSAVYVEDGIEAYSNHEFRTKSLPSVILGKVLYGRWWEDATPLYASDYIQSVRATFPNSVRPELKHLPVRGIDRDPLISTEMQEIVARYFDTVGFQIPSDISHIAVAPHSNILDRQPELARRIETALTNFDSTNVAVKYHPRDQSADYLDVDLVTIPADIPIEIVYIATPDIRGIIGGRSTGIMTAKWITDAEVLSVYLDWDSSDKRIISTLKEIGVRAVETSGTS